MKDEIIKLFPEGTVFKDEYGSIHISDIKDENDVVMYCNTTFVKTYYISVKYNENDPKRKTARVLRHDAICKKWSEILSKKFNFFI